MNNEHVPPLEDSNISKVTSVTTWSIEDHICRKCFGRILSTPEGDKTRFQCSNCGYAVVAGSVPSLCCCGITYKRSSRQGSKNAIAVDAGIRCIHNPMPTTDFCCEIVASEVAHSQRKVPSH